MERSLRSKPDLYIKVLLSRLGELCERGENFARTRDRGDSEERPSSRYCKADAEEMCASASQRTISGQRRGTEFEDLPLTKELFAMGTFWEKENQFSPVKRTKCRPHAQE